MIKMLTIMYLSIWASQYMLIKSTELLIKKQTSGRRKVLFSFIMVLSYLFFGLFAHSSLEIGSYSFLLNLFGIGVIVCSFKLKNLHKKERFNLWLAASLNMILYYGASYLGNILLFADNFKAFYRYASFMTFVMQVCLYLLLKRYNPAKFLGGITTNLVVEWLISTVILVNLVLISITQYFLADHLITPNNEEFELLMIKLNYYVLIFFVDFLISGLLIGVSSYVLFEVKQRQLQESIVLHQHFYIQNLEKMQRDMRLMRHDYKNILSGLIIQVQDGDVIGIKDYLEQTVSQFDTHIGKSLRQSTYLSKVEVIELKGLLLMKLVEMEQQDIECQLEVVRTVTTVNMAMPDLVRCMGILLDNAIEALADNLEKELKVVISQEASDLSIIVKNTVKERPMLQKIWQEGYSTKGKDRGLGLFSYQQIVDKYPNVLRETRYEEQDFTQILKIKGVQSMTV